MRKHEVGSSERPSTPMQPAKPMKVVTKVVAHLRTDVGMVREHNEDSAYVDPAGTFFIVADGMGGHAAGEVASAMAVEAVKHALEEARKQITAFGEAPSEESRHELVKVLEESVRKAHQAVFERGGKEADKKGMGTTLDVLLLADGEAFVAHVGDSRTYLLRSGAAAQVTTDHTVAEVLVIEGKLSPEEARVSPLRTILVNAIGVSADVGVELAHIRLRRSDKILLCSDGLHDYFPAESELADLLEEQGGPDGLTRLVEMAKQRGGHDNITGVLIEVVEGNPTLQEEEDDARAKGEALAKSQSPEDRAAVPSSLSTEPTLPTPDPAVAGKKPGGAKTSAERATVKQKAMSGDKTPTPTPASAEKPSSEKGTVELKKKTGRREPSASDPGSTPDPEGGDAPSQKRTS
jgi:serine/threonine protein phosphatase PrpC